MNELQAILKVFEECQQKKEDSYLATIVNTQGSTYRRPGARMLMTSTGQMVGAISGGCLENDVLEHTRQRMPSGRPIVVTYDTTADEDIIWGFGIGCNGVVQVLIERLARSLNPLPFIQQCFNKRQRGVIATVFKVEGSVEIAIGARLMLASDGSISSDIEDPNLWQTLVYEAKSALHAQQSNINQYQLPGGSIEVFIEVIHPPTPLIIFGAGSDAISIVQFAKALGWQVTVVDCRANEVTRDRFLMADRVILTRREMLDKQVSIDLDTVAVVMTHNYFDDLEILKMLLPSSVKYIGILGAKQRTNEILQQIHHSKEQLDKLYFPVGLDIGAETPQEIAIAIIAEIQAVLSNRCGGMLKDRKGSIHQKLTVKVSPVDILKEHYVSTL
ncbi:XdhC/CoxI family protein [Oscillatoria sp. FACHB-1406]|uniref:XdhC family protein n=1 Tax=Oscillatoria sp. FACHB-1406 TaxID=2692846 RepID=UPI0016832EC2|nr:XdhC/CoxI family protein [Oscillatoria sp. FACHB-1406]MBD2580450.1 XdhC family protein [Oscillatoria sp. FACHB-1406]